MVIACVSVSINFRRRVALIRLKAELDAERTCGQQLSDAMTGRQCAVGGGGNG